MKRAALPTVDVSREEFSSIIGAIYDCALEPNSWPRALERVCDRVGATGAALAVHQLSRTRQSFAVDFGCDPAALQLFRERYVTINPFNVAGNFFKVGDVVSVGDVMDYDVFLKGRFFKEWAEPQGWLDNIVGVLSKSGDKLGFIGVNLPTRALEPHKAVVKDLLPHLQRAVAISDLLNFRAAEVARLSAAVDGLNTGVVFLAADLKVLDINVAAERMMERRILAVVNDRLLPSNTSAGQALRTAVAACAEGQLAELRTPTIVFDGHGSGMGLVAHVLPLGHRDDAMAGEAVAAVFLTDPEAPVRLPIEALVVRFELTPSELRVLMGLIEGQTPRAIAEAHGIAMPTIRTHLRRLYEKTGTQGQMELTKLAMAMSAPQAPRP